MLSGARQWLSATPSIACACTLFVSDDLNRDAIASYLASGMNVHLEMTAFADIQRLPPAHTITISDGHVDLRQYWALPYPEPLDESRADVIIDTFRDLLETGQLPTDCEQTRLLF